MDRLCPLLLHVEASLDVVLLPSSQNLQTWPFLAYIASSCLSSSLGTALNHKTKVKITTANTLLKTKC